jgi:hypothetical protein
MYANTGATLRGDIQQAVIQAGGADLGLIGAQVMPPLSVATKAGQYLKIDIGTGHLMRVDADASLRGQDGSYNRISRAFTSDTYLCADRGLEELIDDSQQADLSRFLDTEATIAKLLLRNIKLGHEIRVANTIFNSSNFTATAAGTAWSNSASDPVSDILSALERLAKKGIQANTLVVNLEVYNLLRKNAKVQSYIFGSVGTGDLRNVDAALIAQNLNIQNVLVASAAYDTSKKGQADSGSFIWASNRAWVGNVQGGDFVAGGAGRTLTWTADSSDLFTVETYRDESRRSGVVRVRQHTAEKVVDSTAGQLITWS